MDIGLISCFTRKLCTKRTLLFTVIFGSIVVIQRIILSSKWFIYHNTPLEMHRQTLNGELMKQKEEIIAHISRSYKDAIPALNGELRNTKKQTSRSLPKPHTKKVSELNSELPNMSFKSSTLSEDEQSVLSGKASKPKHKTSYKTTNKPVDTTSTINGRSSETTVENTNKITKRFKDTISALNIMSSVMNDETSHKSSNTSNDIQSILSAELSKMIKTKENDSYTITNTSKGLISAFIPESLAKFNRGQQTQIGFLKVHKAGSTTLQNMFFRFGLKHNLTFVLPKLRNVITSAKKVLSIQDGCQFDILACHSTYSQGLFQSLLPGNSVYIGIVRDPLDRMISAAYYHRDVFKKAYLMKIPRQNFIQNIINYPDKYDNFPFSRTRNAMGWDFGFSAKIKLNDTLKINAHLTDLKHQFRLVMVMERFEESLVLLKRLLNWELSDILYIQSNAHAHANVTLNSTEISKFRSTCFLDYALHETFTKVFDYMVQNEGRGFQDEISQFKTVLSKVSQFCNYEPKLAKQVSLTIMASTWNDEFYVKSTDCNLMKTGEVPFMQMMKERHIMMN